MTEADTSRTGAREGGAVEPYGHYFTDDPAKFAMPGSGFKLGPVPPDHCVSVTPVYAQSAIDTLRAQLEAAEERAETEAEDCERLARANIAYSQQVNELIGRAGNAEARAEAAEADAARLRVFADEFGHAVRNSVFDDGEGDGPMLSVTAEWANNLLELIDAARTKEAAP